MLPSAPSAACTWNDVISHLSPFELAQLQGYVQSQHAVDGTTTIVGLVAAWFRDNPGAGGGVSAAMFEGGQQRGPQLPKPPLGSRNTSQPANLRSPPPREVSPALTQQVTSIPGPETSSRECSQIGEKVRDSQPFPGFNTKDNLTSMIFTATSAASRLHSAPKASSSDGEGIGLGISGVSELRGGGMNGSFNHGKTFGDTFGTGGSGSGKTSTTFEDVQRARLGAAYQAEAVKIQGSRNLTSLPTPPVQHLVSPRFPPLPRPRSTPTPTVQSSPNRTRYTSQEAPSTTAGTSATTSGTSLELLASIASERTDPSTKRAGSPLPGNRPGERSIKVAKDAPMRSAFGSSLTSQSGMNLGPGLTLVPKTSSCGHLLPQAVPAASFAFSNRAPDLLPCAMTLPPAPPPPHLFVPGTSTPSTTPPPQVEIPPHPARPTLWGGHATPPILSTPAVSGLASGNSSAQLISGIAEKEVGQQGLITAGKADSEEGRMRKSIRALVDSVAPGEVISEQAEMLLLAVCDEFIDSIVRGGCQLARHRQSTRLETQDLALHLERNYGIKASPKPNKVLSTTPSRLYFINPTAFIAVMTSYACSIIRAEVLALLALDARMNTRKEGALDDEEDGREESRTSKCFADTLSALQDLPHHGKIIVSGIGRAGIAGRQIIGTLHALGNLLYILMRESGDLKLISTVSVKQIPKVGHDSPPFAVTLTKLSRAREAANPPVLSPSPFRQLLFSECH
ncbi:transcription initiation factor TFIID subunit 12, partial [Phenoliferia sp. Uapishka_3]